MKRYVSLVLVALGLAMNTYAQSGTAGTPMVIESQMILPKRGMEDKFEAAIIAHNKKYHPAGPYTAGLRKIDYGPRAGWYVWVFGPTSYGSLDTRPTKENGHDVDWTTTIDPLVQEYGSTGLFDLNNDLSYGFDIFLKSKHYELWGVDLKSKQYYRFKALCQKLKKVYETLGTTAFVVLDNDLHAKDGPDVVLIWSFNTYSDWQKDPGPKATYEKLYGEGSWQTAMDEWMDIINSYDSEIRSIIQ
jgi:hypothetical protein